MYCHDEKKLSRVDITVCYGVQQISEQTLERRSISGPYRKMDTTKGSINVYGWRELYNGMQFANNFAIDCFALGLIVRIQEAYEL